MLPAQLLRVTIRKGMIAPRFCTQDHELDLAERILKEFRESHRAREKKSELYERISLIESTHNDYKLIRGLSALLERRCTFSASSYIMGTIIPGNKGATLAQDSDTTTTATAITTTIDGAAMVVNPIDVRRTLFEESSRRGFALTELERESIINSISEKLRVSPNDVKRTMWSDLDDNLVFERFDDIDDKTLIGWYNLSLIQTLLFNATKMEFRVSGGANWKRILRNVKRLGLMYYLEDRSQQGNSNSSNNDSGYGSLVCSLEGPLSLFKLTDSYGTSFAKLLPSIVLPRESVDWQIEAWVLRKTMMQGKKLHQFKISKGEQTALHLADPFYTTRGSGGGVNDHDGNNDKERRHTSLVTLNDHYSFDSVVEEKFAQKFNEVAGGRSGWKLVREPDPLIVGEGKAFIPDFMFEKYGRRVYLEIVGFWTPEYLKRKLQKVNQIFKANINSSDRYKTTKNDAAGIDLFIAINDELAGSMISSSSSYATTLSTLIPADRLIFYKNDSVPIRPILDHLKDLDKEMVDRKVRDPNLKIEIDYSRDIIPLKDIAEKYDLPIEVVSKIASRDHGERYICIGSGGGVLGDRPQDYYLVSMAKAKELELLLSEVNTFETACTIFSDNGIPEACHAQLVEELGYEVIWQNIDISTAAIQKRK
ncbi:MAG TPA: DUF790 family protein [Nitrososphaera sp.]|nr:DUF790 family protein [Nitrososphaera sp.]